MRTTLDWEKPVLDAWNALGEKEGPALRKLASRLLAEALAREESGKKKTAPFRWISSDMSSKIDISGKETLCRTLDIP